MAVIRVEHFDGLYGQDPFAYYDYAVALREHLGEGRLPPPFYWPIGYPLIAATAFLLFGVTPAVAQGVNVVLGAALGPLVYWLTRELLALEGRASLAVVSALVAGVVTLFSGALLLSSIVIMSDVAALFWSTLAGIGLIRYLRFGQARWIVVAAFAWAWAIGTRYASVSLAVPYGALLIHHRIQLGKSKGGSRSSGRG